jgi:hypothetical protein
MKFLLEKRWLNIVKISSLHVNVREIHIGTPRVVYYLECNSQYGLRYTHKTSGFKTSGFKTSGFITSETSGLQNVSFTKRQVYKMSGLQNVRSSKRPVAKKHPYIYSVLAVGGNPQVLLQPC